MNARADRSWADGSNRLPAERDTPGDNIWLVDWNALSNDCVGDCFAADGIHLAADGKVFYADVIGDITGL